ncbi:MAG: VPS10 domain-containing protein [Bryobacteraceae bacterium]
MRPAIALLFPLLAFAQNSKDFDNLTYRFIGPAGMGGRITDVESVPGNPNTAYVATGGGGLWKTTNGGVTWTPIFERQNTFSLGDIALDPRNPEVIWAGTGETNPRNSVSFGDGIYRSTDGGKNWVHLGLENTERITRILVNPLNPDIVYVGALGHAFGPHRDRGVFMTTDGGKTWVKTLYIDENHGVSDLEIDPRNPNILYAAMWKFERKPWTFTSGGDKGGVFRSADGGRTWKKLTEGLPKLLGRVGVKVAPSNTARVYVIAESNEGTLFVSSDSGDKFVKVTDNADIVWRGFYFTDLRVDPVNDSRLYFLSYTLYSSIDGGKTIKDTAPNVHPDMHALWIDPSNPANLWLGSDGGVALSRDQGASWDYRNNIPLGQYYQIHADNRLPFYHLTGGQQDNSTWSGPSRTTDTKGISNADWTLITGGDGFYALSDPNNPDIFLSESQGGRITRTNVRTREQQSLSPSPRSGLLADNKYRFNWNTPIVASPHGKSTYYFAGNVIFQSPDFGKTWEPISPDLTTNDRSKYAPAGGPVWFEATTAENNGTIISIAESPVKPGVIWAGTDDGNLQVTMMSGRNWINVTPNIPPASVITHVEPSRVNAETAYVAIERHMFDDFKPYIFKTTDSGKTFTNIAGNLPPKAYLQVIREDPKNPKLLYAGTELGLFASWTGGNEWVPLLMKNMPRVAVHDLLVHPRDNDLVVATHGRGIAIFDDAAPLQQMSAETAARRAHIFPPQPALRHYRSRTNSMMGDQSYIGPNPAYGALLTYYLKEKPSKEKPAKLHVFDQQGKKIAEIRSVAGEPGLNRATWNLRYEAPRLRADPPPGAPAADAEGPGGPGGGPQAVPGKYVVKLLLGDDVAAEQTVEVRMDPTLTVSQADLQTQFDHAIRLRDLASNVNDALRALDLAKTQIEANEKLAAKPDQPKIAEWKKRVEEELTRFASGALRYRTIKKPRLAEEVGPLLSAIGGGNAAPTVYQIQAAAQLAAEYKTEAAAYNQFRQTIVPAWNEEMRKLGLPGLSALKPISE